MTGYLDESKVHCIGMHEAILKRKPNVCPKMCTGERAHDTYF